MTEFPDERRIWSRGLVLFLVATSVWYLLGAFVRPDREPLFGLPAVAESVAAGLVVALGATAVRLFAVRKLEDAAEE